VSAGTVMLHVVSCGVCRCDVCVKVEGSLMVLCYQPASLMCVWW
jgi:hypothetical protein